MKKWSIVSALLCQLLGTGVLATESHADDPENDVVLLQSRFSMSPSPPDSYDAVRGHIKSDLKQLQVNLDEEPEKRWRNVTRYYMDLGVYPKMVLEREPLPKAVEQMAVTARISDEHLREKLGMLADMGLDKSYLPHLLIADLDDEVYGLSDKDSGLTGTGDYGTELVRIAKAKSGCTGIVAAMPNGTVVHGRNMDWAGFHLDTGDRTLYYQDVVVEVIFMKGGKPLTLSINWPLTTGIHTGMRLADQAWSYEQNTRFHVVGTSILSGLFHDTESLTLAARRVLETTADFETAVQRMQELRLLSPHYIIMAGSGPYQGAVIAADRDGEKSKVSPRVRRLSSLTATERLALAKDTTRNVVDAGWHILQTNDDQNKPATDDRRPFGNMMLAMSSQDQVKPEWAFRELGTPPVFNQKTLFTSVFVPQSGYHKTLLYMDHKLG